MSRYDGLGGVIRVPGQGRCELLGAKPPSGKHPVICDAHACADANFPKSREIVLLSSGCIEVHRTAVRVYKNL